MTMRIATLSLLVATFLPHLCRAATLRSGNMVIQEEALTPDQHRRRMEEISSYWTKERVESAIPRDMYVNKRRRRVQRSEGEEDQAIVARHLHNDNQFLIKLDDSYVECIVKFEPFQESGERDLERVNKAPARVTQVSPARSSVETTPYVDIVVDVYDGDGGSDISKLILFLYKDGEYSRSFFDPDHGNGRYTFTVGPLQDGFYKWAVMARDSSRVRQRLRFKGFKVDLSLAPPSTTVPPPTTTTTSTLPTTTTQSTTSTLPTTTTTTTLPTTTTTTSTSTVPTTTTQSTTTSTTTTPTTPIPTTTTTTSTTTTTESTTTTTTTTPTTTTTSTTTATTSTSTAPAGPVEVNYINPAFGNSPDPVDFEWEVKDHGKQVTMVLMLLEYPDGSQAYLTRNPTGNGKDNILLPLEETGNFRWAIWPQIDNKDFEPGEWTPFSIDSSSTNPDDEGDDEGDDLAPLCGQSIARYTQRNQDLHKAVGRILFRFGTNNYICSGTLVEGNDDRAIIATAAHCIYDTKSKQFPTYVMFIPGQDDGGTDGSDFDCNNDPHGCFYPTIGVISDEYTTATFQGGFQYDYGFYVAPDSDAGNNNAGSAGKIKSLKPMGITFNGMTVGGNTHLFGYPGSHDPQFMYTEGRAETSPITDGGWYVDCSGLTGGASGGPWTQSDPATGQMVVASVNSWGWGDGSTGMGSPPYDTGGAECVYNAANSANMAGGHITASCPK